MSFDFKQGPTFMFDNFAWEKEVLEQDRLALAQTKAELTELLESQVTCVCTSTSKHFALKSEFPAHPMLQ